MRFTSLPQWLAWQETLHFTDIDPGLDRIGRVWQQLAGSEALLPFKVITVAGTNGKGSSVALLDAILRAAGYRTGTYTSPHILKYNERICVDGMPCDDATICSSFDRIDTARQTTSLSYFEFATLAAIDIFQLQNIDIAILEVGMGGRLDAVNLFDTDIALITPISLDHTAWLGSTVEKIAFEKAGIICSNKPVVCSQAKPAISIVNHAQSLSAPLFKAQSDYDFQQHDNQWHWQNKQHQWQNLPLPALLGDYQIRNAAAVLQVISLLNQQDITIPLTAIKTGLQKVELAGRFQQIKGDVDTILDVTHNQQGAENLAQLLSTTPCQGRTFAVLAMLKDKDAIAVASELKQGVDQWFVAGLTGGRGMTSAQLAAQLSQVIADDKIESQTTVEQAYQQAIAQAKPEDRVIVLGSFHTVEAVLRLIQ